nr:hybrid sensor histidine kinase/response regulator transcription factor [Hufsiella arboris]
MINPVRKLILFFTYILFVAAVSATCVAGTKYPIRYLGIEQGLSNNAVTSVYQDQYGFIWLGTYDGLNRYDGTKFKIFRNIWGDETSLKDNHIIALSGVKDKIFIGTQRGLIYYNYQDAKFYPVSFKNKQGKSQPINSNINALITTKVGDVYVATENNGLLVYSGANGDCKQLFTADLKSTYNVQALTADAGNSIWLFIKDTGVCKLENGKIRVINRSLKSATCLLSGNDKKLWIGTENGLFSYNHPQDFLSRFDESREKLSSQNIFDIKQDKSSLIWIGTNGGGVNVLDPGTKKINYILPGQQRGSLESGAVNAIYEDRNSRKWIATLRGGVNIIDNKPEIFPVYRHDPFNNNSVVNNFILSFCEDKKDNIWIGTDGGGLSYWNPAAGKFTNYTHTSQPNSLVSNFVTSVAEDYTGQIWVATFSGGIDAFDNSRHSFKHYDCYNPVTKRFDSNLWKLFEDSRHNLWAGTTRGGALYKYNRQADRFELFDHRLTNIHTIFEDKAGRLWAGNYSQLIRIDIQNRKHQYIHVGHAIRSITGDDNNILWLGSEGGGLLKFDCAKKRFTRYTQVNGLPSNTILNILIDNKGVLWCSTYSGLTRFDPATGQFKNFDVSDGLQSNQFNYNAGLKLKNGALMFGGINGFNIFYPDSISYAVSYPEIKITGLKINNKLIEGSSPYTDYSSVVELRKIQVPYDDATIAIDYASLEYSRPDKINYAYFLEGWDHGWNAVGNLKTAYYTRLNEGHYTLHIKATDTNGSWNSRQLIVDIIVLPPWYRTWWAYLIYTGIFAALVYSFLLYRTRQSNLKYEIEIANLKMEREKELNERKLSFFTNISHEFRTPLTLIINPIKDLLKQRGDKDNSELNLIYRNARRLLRLVDQLLLFRKIESENDSLKMTCINLCALCNDVYLSFVHQAKLKSIEYEFNCPDEDIQINADRDKIEIALFNLLSNAFKFTPEGGKVIMTITGVGDRANIQISDTGCGIDTSTGDKIFEKFYQTKDKSLKTGFGIGLYLVKTFIESHEGEISHTINEQGGTTFNIVLQKAQDPAAEIDNSEKSELIDELFQDDYNDKAPDDEPYNLELLISDRQAILIIDDNDEIRAYIKSIFKDNYKIYQAVNGSEGLEQIRRFLPDIVISDIMMQGIDGIELCRVIKQDSSLSHIPVILLTGDATPGLKLKGIEVGAIDFVSKPFEKDLLVARVQGILRNKTELQNYFYNEITLKYNTRNISEHHKEFLYKCVSIIENNLSDPNFDVQTIAKEMGTSYSSLFKKVKSISGQSVTSFIRFVRLRKAAEIMINTNCNVNEAALNAGFNDIKYFREHFTRLFGIKPSEFIKKHRTAFHKTYLVEKYYKYTEK